MRETVQLKENFLLFREAVEFFDEVMKERAAINFELVQGAIEYDDFRWDVSMNFLRKL